MKKKSKEEIASEIIKLRQKTKHDVEQIRIELEKKIKGNVTFDSAIQELIKVYRRETE